MSAVLLAFSLLCEGMAEYLPLNLRENIYKSLDVLSILGEHFSDFSNMSAYTYIYNLADSVPVVRNKT